MKSFNCHVFFNCHSFPCSDFFLFLCNEMSDFSSCNGRNWGGVFIERVVILYFSRGVDLSR